LPLYMKPSMKSAVFVNNGEKVLVSWKTPPTAILISTVFYFILYLNITLDNKLDNTKIFHGVLVNN